MRTVTVPRIVRTGAGYGTIAERFGVAPTLVDPVRGVVEFPDATEGEDPPLDLAAVSEYLITPNDTVLNQRRTVAEARALVIEHLSAVAAFQALEAPDLEDHFAQIHALTDAFLAAAGAFTALASLVLGQAD